MEKISLREFHRKNRPPAPKRPKTPLDQLILDLRGFVDENGRDRVAASRTLYDVLVARGDLIDPLVPNDTASITKSLTRMLKAVGKSLAQTAWNAAFPSEVAPDTPEDRPGPSASRDHVD